jgi:protoheme IX farnesyltransferase
MLATMPMMLKIKIYADLCRVPLSLFAAASAATGCALGPHPGAARALATAASVFVLACGASALNQFQERDLDARMARTRKRPLPSGALTPRHALTISIFLMAAGLAILGAASTMRTAALGLVAIGWYNGLYTFLKKRTALAFIPGAVVGMIPPAMGWLTAGGSLLDPRLTVLGLIFFLWQIPHVWLLLLQYGEEYDQAGLPSLARWLNRGQIARLAFIWILAVAAASLALPLVIEANVLTTYAALIPAAAWLAFSGFKLMGGDPSLETRTVFRRVNAFMVLIMCTLCFGHFIPPLR